MVASIRKVRNKANLVGAKAPNKPNFSVFGLEMRVERQNKANSVGLERGRKMYSEKVGIRATTRQSKVSNKANSGLGRAPNKANWLVGSGEMGYKRLLKHDFGGERRLGGLCRRTGRCLGRDAGDEGGTL